MALGNDDGTCFRRKSPISSNKFKKIYDFFLFRKFLIKELEINKYDRLIVFSPQLAIFLFSYLKKKYPNNFLLDYRDLSIEQNCMLIFKKILNICPTVVISSPGFKKYLPHDHQYVLSHNYRYKESRNMQVPSAYDLEFHMNQMPIKIATIGGIRDYEQNRDLIDVFKNNVEFEMYFNGTGISEGKLKLHTELNSVSNVTFTGYYEKEMEFELYLNTTFVNIFYPKKATHETAISNRFYNALIHKRPMIVTKGGIQAKYVEKYNLGISVNDANEIEAELILYIKNFKPSEFISNCNYLIKSFESDYVLFKRELLKFCSLSL